jgi:hypothetical protein
LLLAISLRHETNGRSLARAVFPLVQLIECAWQPTLANIRRSRAKVIFDMLLLQLSKLPVSEAHCELRVKLDPYVFRIE